MHTSLRILSPVLLFVIGCGSDSDASSEDGASGGKADDLDDVECAPAQELSLELLAGDKETSADGDKLTNRVAATCFNASGFENAECCADAGLFTAYREATSCPETVELAKVPGNASAQRCRNASNGQFVDAACCSDLCDPAARRNSGGACIDSGGKFEDEMCCFLAASLEAASCSGATWETVSIAGTDRDVCRGENSSR